MLGQKVAAVLEADSESARRAQWGEILNVLHEQATEIPFSGKSIPAVFNARLGGYVKGLQQFDYPMHTIRVISGAKTITVAPGGQTGLFKGVGRLDPHSYRPNEFFANNWVYEGLVEYGPDGTILPALAESWSVADNGAGQKYTFALRQGVKFHDGGEWNCAVAKLNFDHVLAEELTTGDWHGWYGLPKQIDGVSCADTHTLVLTTKGKYYPLLQELTYIRPMRMLSGEKFACGPTSDAYTCNSCPGGWGNITSTATPAGKTIECKGTTGIAGTGRWIYSSTESEVVNGEDVVKSVTFKRNPTHWDASSAQGVVEQIKLVAYADHAAVKAALLDGSLDAVVGAGVLEPADIAAFRNGDHGADAFVVSLTAPLMNRVVVFNTNKAPTNDLTNRKIMIHAVDKKAIIDKEMAGLAKPVANLFPLDAPYCNVDLTPVWSYDLEKSKLLNCPVPVPPAEKTGLPIGAGVALAAAVVVLGALFLYMRGREKSGNPLFTPLNGPAGKNVQMR